MKSILFNDTLITYLIFNINWCHNFIISYARIIFLSNALIVANCNDLIRVIEMIEMSCDIFFLKSNNRCVRSSIIIQKSRLLVSPIFNLSKVISVLPM